MKLQVNTQLFNKATGTPYNPPQVDTLRAIDFDSEFGDMVDNIRSIMDSCGFRELYECRRSRTGPAHYHLVREHSNDRTVAVELLHSSMGADSSKWIPLLQSLLGKQREKYQVIVSTSFEDDEGIKLLPGFAGLVIRFDAVIAHFSTAKMVGFFVR